MKQPLLLLTLLFFLSCSRTPEHKEFYTKGLNKKQLAAVIEFCRPYNAIIDTDDFGGFTYELEEKLQGKNLCIIGSILDIVKDDSIYTIVSNYSTYGMQGYNDNEARIKSNSDMAHKLTNAFNSSNSEKVALVFTVEKMRSVQKTIEHEYDEDGNPYFYWNSNKGLLLTYGTLQDYFIIPIEK